MTLEYNYGLAGQNDITILNVFLLIKTRIVIQEKKLGTEYIKGHLDRFIHSGGIR